MKKLLFFLSTSVVLLVIASCSEDNFATHEGYLVESEISSLKRSCNTVEHTIKLLEDPVFKEGYERRIKAFRTLNKSSFEKAICANPKIIPVAVHYQGASDPDVACLINLAKEQIAILNADFQGKNSDITKWTNGASTSFPGVGFAETCLQFCLADQNHPSGYNLSNGDPAVTVNQTQGDEVGQWAGYLNIIVQTNLGYLGHAPYGGAGNGDAVVIDASAFGSTISCGNINGQAPYNLGRTTTHEVGHFFLLDHIWGNGCGTDDEVTDTPDQDFDYGGCPSIGQSSCGSTDMHMNFMDYTDDACMYMFSNGQAIRMEDYISANLSNLVNNASNVCSEAAQNGGGDTGGGDNTDNCITPVNTTVTTITSTSLSFNWEEIEGAIKYKIRIRQFGTTQWMNQSPTGSGATFDNLSAGTTYQYRIRTQCADGWTSWSGISNVETESDGGGNQNLCDAPESASAQNVTANTANISWSSVEGAIRYQVRYREKGFGNPWQKQNTDETNTPLSGLFSNSTYEYRVRTRCEESWTSYTAIGTFTTSVDGNEGGGTESGGSRIATVEITLDDFGSETTWYILNENDRVLSEGGPYGDFNAGRVKTKDVELTDGCYLFVIEDYYGDGICCDWGNGSARILDSSGYEIVASDGRFGTFEEIQFCLDNGASRVGKIRKARKAKNLPPKTR